MTVNDLMTRTVHTCRPGDHLHIATKHMCEHHCGCLPVIDDAGRVVGLLSHRDVCVAASSHDRPLSALTVSDAMSTDVVVCAPGDSLATAEQLMGTRQVRRLPVVDEGRLVGILSVNDLALAALSPVSRRKRTAPSALEVVETMALICARRASAPSP
jgi:CBS domain-containing protein